MIQMDFWGLYSKLLEKKWAQWGQAPAPFCHELQPQLRPALQLEMTAQLKSVNSQLSHASFSSFMGLVDRRQLRQSLMNHRIIINLKSEKYEKGNIFNDYAAGTWIIQRMQ